MNPEDQKAITESLEENGLNMESPISGNIRGYYKGFSIQLTCRNPKQPIKPLLDKMVEMANYMELNGWKPSWNPDTNAKTAGGTGYSCKICGQEAEFKSGTTKTGKPYKALFCVSGEKTHTQWL